MCPYEITLAKTSNESYYNTMTKISEVVDFNSYGALIFDTSKFDRAGYFQINLRAKTNESQLDLGLNLIV